MPLRHTYVPNYRQITSERREKTEKEKRATAKISFPIKGFNYFKMKDENNENKIQKDKARNSHY